MLDAQTFWLEYWFALILYGLDHWILLGTKKLLEEEVKQKMMRMDTPTKRKERGALSIVEVEEMGSSKVEENTLSYSVITFCNHRF